jgi:hypothetical protein
MPAPSRPPPATTTGKTGLARPIVVIGLGSYHRGGGKRGSLPAMALKSVRKEGDDGGEPDEDYPEQEGDNKWEQDPPEPDCRHREYYEPDKFRSTWMHGNHPSKVSLYPHHRRFS